jgi:hypothetical protein
MNSPKTITATIIDRSSVKTLEEFFALLFAARDTVLIVGDRAYIPSHMPRAADVPQPRPPSAYVTNKRRLKSLISVLTAARTPTRKPLRQPPALWVPPAKLQPSKVPATPKADSYEYITKRYRAMTAKYPASRGITRTQFVEWAQGSNLAKLYAAFVASGKKPFLTPTAYLRDSSGDWRPENLAWLTRGALRKQEAWAFGRKRAER